MDLTGFIYSSPLAIAMIVSAVFAVALAAYVWQRRSAPGAVYFILLMVCAAEWSIMGFLEIAVPGLQAKAFTTQLSYLSVVFIGPLWLLFALDYSRQRDWITRRNIVLLCIVPVATLAFVMTNSWHGLVWPQITLASDAPGAVPVYQHGIVYGIHAVYSYLLLIAGFGVLAKTAISSQRGDRLVIMAILLGFFVVCAGSLPYVIQFKLLEGTDVTPLSMVMAGFIVTWLIFRNRLFDIVPAALETLISSMCDGVIVIDDAGLIAEMNPAAYAMIGARNDSVGKPADAVLGRWPDLYDHCHAGTIGTPSEIRLDGPEEPRWLDIRVSLLPIAGGSQTGRLIVMRDITELKRRGDELQQSHEALQAEMLERKRAEERIRLSLQEKEVMLKEIHHRVKNNMQIISSLLNLQSDSVSVESAAAFRESQNRIKSMALIHEKLYQSRDLSHIDFGEYADSLTSYLTTAYITGHEVTISRDIKDISLGIDTAIPCGLIISELVSNSLKHAFKDGRRGTIRIGLSVSDGTYQLVVGDNGTGLPPGIDYRNTASLGLQLVNTLVEQLDGTIDLWQENGTTFMITFREIVHMQAGECW